MSSGFNLFDELFNQLLPLIDEDNRVFSGESATMRKKRLARCIKLLLQQERLQLLTRLSHFVAVIHQHQLSYIDLFFHIPISAPSVREKFNDQEAIYAHYSDGSSYCTYATSSLDLIYTANVYAELLGLPALLSMCDRIGSDPTNRQRVDNIAKECGDQFDAYRRSRGGSSHKEKHFNSIRRFLDQHFGEGLYSPRSIGSDHVLEYWRSHWGKQTVNVKKYSQAHRLIVLFVDLFSQYSEEKQTAASDSLNDDTYNARVAHLEDGSQTVPEDPPEEEWAALHMDYSPVRFLKGTDLSFVGVFLDLPRSANHLMLSALRSHVFSPLENRMINAARLNSSEAVISSVLQQIERKEVEQNYPTTLAKFDTTFALFRRSILASLYHLIFNRHNDGLQLLYTLSSEEGDGFSLLKDLHAMGIEVPEFEDFDDLDEALDYYFQALFEAIAQNKPLSPRLAAAIKTTEQAWKKCHQAGFREQDLNDPRITDLFSLASDRYALALNHFEYARRLLLKQVGEVDQQQEDDFDTMYGIYSRIYRPKHEEQPS